MTGELPEAEAEVEAEAEAEAVCDKSSAELEATPKMAWVCRGVMCCEYRADCERETSSAKLSRGCCGCLVLLYTTEAGLGWGLGSRLG